MNKTIDNDHETKVRLRRTKSVTRAEQIQRADYMVRRSQPDKPCHRPRDSLFSWSSGFDNFTGFINWGFLLLGLGGVRLLLENFIKYGVRVDPREWFFFLSGKNDGNEEYPSILLICYSSVPVTLCLLIEKGLALNIIAHSPGIVFHVVNLIVMVLMPMVVIHVKDSGFSLIGAVYVCMLYAILFLKLWSYVQVNMWCRMSEKNGAMSHGRMRRQSFSYSSFKSSIEHNELEFDDLSSHVDGKLTKPLVQYPDNLHIRDLIYYIFAPTLCYELNFHEQTEYIFDETYFRSICRLPSNDVPVSTMDNTISEKFIDTIHNASFVKFAVMLSEKDEDYMPYVALHFRPWNPREYSMMNMDVAKAVERLLKLAIPNHLLWLCFFYLSFHSYLNLMGELLYFADRNFYCDWWNANNIDTFWRTWNMAVHRWAVRHLYIPIVEMGYGKSTASVIVFFISAFFHEYLVSVPLKTFKVWAFLGMMGQIPLSFVSRHVERRFGARWGNIVVWSSLIIGQPLCIMVYYHDYVVTHFGEILVEDYSTV